jgi:hypothetical protein
MHKERMELVQQARAEETNEATQKGRVYVVSCTPRLVKTAHQARMVGKDILEWLAKDCVMFRLLPEGVVNPKERTEEHVHAIAEHWLEHGELSIVGKRAVAQSRNKHTDQRERDERNHPWMVVITLSSEMMSTGKLLGKTAGQEVVSFQRSKAPLEIQNRMHQQIRAWRVLKRDRGQSSGSGRPDRKKGNDRGPKSYKPGRAAAVMQPKKAAWGKEPAGGWTAAQTAAWEREKQTERQPATTMEERVAKAVAEFIKNPEAVSKKTEEAIKHLGVGPNRQSVEKLAAQVVAYRIESRKTNGGTAAGILYEEGVSHEVCRRRCALCALVEKCESKH